MSADAHTHIAADGTKTIHEAADCPDKDKHVYKLSERNALGHPISDKPLLDSFTDDKGKVHYRRPGS